MWVWTWGSGEHWDGCFVFIQNTRKKPSLSGCLFYMIFFLDKSLPIIIYDLPTCLQSMVSVFKLTVTLIFLRYCFDSGMKNAGLKLFEQILLMTVHWWLGYCLLCDLETLDGLIRFVEPFVSLCNTYFVLCRLAYFIVNLNKYATLNRQLCQIYCEIFPLETTA